MLVGQQLTNLTMYSTLTINDLLEATTKIMEIKLTNEQLALFFDERLKGDIISDDVDTYKLTNPILHINGLYKDEIECEIPEEPIGTRFDKTVLLISIPLEYGVVYDSIILIKEKNRLGLYDVESNLQDNRIRLDLPWTTYDFGTGRDIEIDDDYEEKFYAETDLYNLNIQSDADLYLEITIEPVVDLP